MSAVLKARALFPVISSVICKRYIHTTSVNKAEIPSLTKLKRLQTKFQVENGKPIFLRGGPTDRILFNITKVACGLGIVMVIDLLYNLAKPS